MATSTTNGKHVKKLTGPPRTKGYRPVLSSIPGWGLGLTGQLFGLAYVDQMRWDSHVALCLRYKKAPLFGSELAFESPYPEVAKFSEDMTRRFWRGSLAKALTSYDYGHMAGEVLYKRGQGGITEFGGIKPIHPRDATAYSLDEILAYVQVSAGDSSGGSGPARLEAANRIVLPDGKVEECDDPRPAKGWWLTHDSSFSPFHGRSVLLPAWWPWRIKTMEDGVFEILLKWAYRHSLGCFVGRYPDEMIESEDGGEQHARDLMRQMMAMLKAGASIVLGNERDENGNFMWDISQYAPPSEATAGRSLIEYSDWLNREIQRGIGIPDEIITHTGNTGGYSRSQVAASTFFIESEQSRDHVIECWTDQILKPLVTLNFGKNKAEFTIKPKPLIPPDQPQGNMAQGGGPPGQPPQNMLGGGGPQGGQPAGGGGGDQWVPYQGPRGGAGQRNPATGAVKYGQFSRAAEGIEQAQDAANAEFYTRIRERLRRITMGFDPNEARDESGKWTAEGAKGPKTEENSSDSAAPKSDNGGMSKKAVI